MVVNEHSLRSSVAKVFSVKRFDLYSAIKKLLSLHLATLKAMHLVTSCTGRDDPASARSIY